MTVTSGKTRNDLPRLRLLARIDAQQEARREMPAPV